MRLKADISQLNLQHRTKKLKKWEKKKLKIKMDMLRSIGKSPWSQSRRMATVGTIVEKEGLKPGVKDWGSDGWWEWCVDGRGSASDRNRWVLEIGMRLTNTIWHEMLFQHVLKSWHESALSATRNQQLKSGKQKNQKVTNGYAQK